MQNSNNLHNANMRLDIHQHLWTEPLLTALARRNSAPLARREGEGWTLVSSGEAPYLIGADETDAEARSLRMAAAGIDRAVIAPSSPIGLEDLPASESVALLDAHLDGVRALPEEFLHWAVSSVWRIDPVRLGLQLDGGAVGLALPAGALAAPEGWVRVAPLLEVLEDRDQPLFVHPGPGPYSQLALGEPEHAWWPALTRYVSEMNAAWFAFAAAARQRHPNLKVVFAMLAGLAPLQHERLRVRAGSGVVRLDDPLVYYETSSYGPDAIDALSAIAGESQIVFGSDAPMTGELALPDSAAATDNAQRLLGLAVAR